MPKPSAIISTVATLMNDTAQSLYDNAAVLPYLNLSLNILQEIYELNGIPITNKTPATINVPAGVSKIGFDTTPAIPSDLIEIQQLWESDEGQDTWIPMVKKEFLPHYLQVDALISQFLVWSWMEEEIRVIPANVDIDLKMDYIGSIFKTPILIGNVDVNIRATNIQTYLEFETASLCAMFIAENETRAMALAGMAGTALDRALGIPIKGMQSILTRRLPFRSSFKRRGIAY